MIYILLQASMLEQRDYTLATLGELGSRLLDDAFRSRCQKG